MANGRKIVIEFLGKDTSAGKTANQVEGKYSKLGGRMNKVGSVAGKALAGGLLIAGAAAVKAGQAAAEDEESQAKLAQTLKTAAGASKGQVAATEDWITAQGKALGVADDQLRPALSKLAIATGDVGKAQKLASLGMDIAAGSGKDLGAVTQALAKAQATGSVTALAKFGIATKDASGKVKTLSQVTRELAEKYQGAAAKAADTTAGKQRKLTLQMGELQEQIGAGLLPIMAKLAEMGLKTIDWMSKHETLTKVLAGTIGGLVGTLWLVSKAMAAVNLVMAMNPIGLVVIAIAALAVGLIYALNHSKKFRDGVMNAFASVGKAGLALWNNVLKPTFRFMVNAWLNVAGWIIKGAARAFGWVPGIGDKLKAAAAKFDTFKHAVNDKLNGIHKNVRITADTSDARKKIGAFVSFYRSMFSKLPKNTHAGAPGGLGGILLQGARASGGPVSARKPYLVGERGPEIFAPQSSGRIIPNNKMGSAGATRGGDINVHFNGLVTDPKAAAREVRKILLELKRTNGGAALGIA